MDLEIITVHEISQMEKDKYYMISLLRGILKSDTRASLYTTCRHLLEMRILRGFSGHNTRGWGVDIALSKEERWCDGLGVRALLPHSRSKWNEEAPKRKRMSEVSTRSLKAERWHDLRLLHSYICWLLMAVTWDLSWGFQLEHLHITFPCVLGCLLSSKGESFKRVKVGQKTYYVLWFSFIGQAVPLLLPSRC